MMVITNLEFWERLRAMRSRLVVAIATVRVALETFSHKAMGPHIIQVLYTVLHLYPMLVYMTFAKNLISAKPAKHHQYAVKGLFRRVMGSFGLNIRPTRTAAKPRSDDQSAGAILPG